MYIKYIIKNYKNMKIKIKIIYYYEMLSLYEIIFLLKLA